jgi:hypothetical protein
LTFLAVLPALRADAFDRYTNPILAQAAGAAGVTELRQLTPELIADHDRVLPGTAAALLVVQTNEGRQSKLLVQSARQKTGDGQAAVPLLLVERYVTYKQGQERAVQASGQNLYLYPDFCLSLDLGQVVPPRLGGDLRFVVEAKPGGTRTYLEPLSKARLYLVTRPLPGTEPRKATRPAIGEPFEPRYFNGTYKLYDDGRRSGTLTLQVREGGEVTGAYYSDKDGQKYAVKGQVGIPSHALQFTIKFPRVEQTFQGWLFTGDGKALTGTSRLLDREAGFYALRLEEE